MEDKSTELEVFLRYVQPDRLLFNGKTPKPNWATILLLSAMFEKYDSPGVARCVLSDQMTRFIRDPHDPDFSPPTGWEYRMEPFALAAIHGLEDVAKRALRWNHSLRVVDAGALSFSHQDKADPEPMARGRRDLSLGDLPVDLLARIPPRVIKTFCQLHTKVVSQPRYSWLNAADDFQVR